MKYIWHGYAVADLGPVGRTQDVFVGFQRYLYAERAG